jgi:hypothetical protein
VIIGLILPFEKPRVVDLFQVILPGYLTQLFEVTRVQALEALTLGLNYQFQERYLEKLPTIFEDVDEISETAQTAIAAATENRIVVNYPNVRKLNPNQFATRAEVAAMICQALANSQQLA